MPANLTAQYLKAEAAYRSAQTPEEELECLQLMLREIPKHKGTDKLQADLKAKIAKLKVDSLKKGTSTGKPANKISTGSRPSRLGGGPKCRKESIARQLNASQTRDCSLPVYHPVAPPGMMAFEDCPIQLIDMPPMSADFFDPELLDSFEAPTWFCLLSISPAIRL